MRMIASGAVWPAGGPGSGAGMSGGGSGRRAGHAGHGEEAVRPVQPTDAPNDRSRGDRSARPADAGHGAPEGGPRDRAQPSADAPGQPGGSRALVPVPSTPPPAAWGYSGAGQGGSGVGGPRSGAHHSARVPVATAPRLSVPVAADAALAVQMVGSAEAMAARGTGSDAQARGESWSRTAPASTAAASDSYRRQGGLPPTGLGSGVIFRLSI